MGKPVPKSSPGPKRRSTTVPPAPRVVRTTFGALSVVVAALAGVGCAARPVGVVEPSHQRNPTSAGITCTEWLPDPSARADVQPSRYEAKNTVVVKLVVHLMHADGHGGGVKEGNVGQLWHRDNIEYFFGWDGKVNEVWKPAVRLRLHRVEKCLYSPKGLRFDGQDRASIFTPILTIPEQWKDPATVSTSSAKMPPNTSLRSARIAAMLEELAKGPKGLAVQGLVLLGVKEEARKEAGDELKRIGVVEDLRGIVAALVEGEGRLRQSGKDLIELSVLLSNKGEQLRQLGETLKEIAGKLVNIADTLPHMGASLKQIRESLSKPRAWFDDAMRQQLSALADDLLKSTNDLTDLTKMRWTLQTGSILGTSVAPSVEAVVDHLKTIETWAPRRSGQDRQISEAPQLFRAVNRRFAAFDPDALHVVLWWKIDEFEGSFRFSQWGYSRAAERGGPAVWADVRCLRDTEDACARLLAHEVGHALTLRHVCAVDGSHEPNVDGLPRCDEDKTQVEGCWVDPRTNLMNPTYPTKRLEMCQSDQAKDEARRQFNR